MADQLATEVKSMKIDDSSGESTLPNGTNDQTFKWGMPIDEAYKLAVTFYRDQDGKGLHVSYKDKLKLVAFTKQAVYGKYRPDVSPDIGYLDVVGSDRKQAWLALGDMSKETAMDEFIKLLDSVCPIFKPYLQAVITEREEKAREQKEEIRKQKDDEEAKKKLVENQAQQQLEVDKQRQQEQENQIRAALNQQTEAQFKQYAEQQYPGNQKQQDELIAQLQEQHLQQYMQQVYQQQLLHQQQQYQQLQAMQASQIPEMTAGGEPMIQQHQQQQQMSPSQQQQMSPSQQQQMSPSQQQQMSPSQQQQMSPSQQQQMSPSQQHQMTPTGQQNGPVSTTTSNTSVTSGEGAHGEEEKQETTEDELPPIAAATMWTRKELKEFKDSLRNDKDSVIKVGAGETVTVRVPTHEDGACLFWEFATDYYDVGFGVYFEWTIAPSNTVSVHVSESSDEEELDEEGEGKPDDIEKGDKTDDRPPTDEIIPVYRRDCHDEVYCGSHTYPGRGVYLLKFDNSYSLWRSKTLYYRVYYSR